MKAATLLALLCIAAFAQQKGTFTDTRDGKTYKTAKIGEQVWMAENLNYEEGGKCYGNDPANCAKYGRLYDWKIAIKACPKGWHLPSNADWDKLYRYADGDKGTESPYQSKTAGKYFKAASGWNDYKGKPGNGEDKFGFSALPGGNGNSGGSFYYAGYYGSWWSSSEGNSYDAFLQRMSYYDEYAGCGYYDKSYLFSVRCVGD
jgi:uncharacterized protein (TIGR02145 family)